jgi:transcriptional regulator with XRE-family HTH domain
MRESATGVSPTVRRRELGALLRALRMDAELTVDQVADQLLCSPSKVSRMETGHRGVSLRDVRDLCELYGVTDQAERERLGMLAREGKVQGWWQPFDLPYDTFVGLESAAVAISDFEPGVLPGLLQSPDYSRAVHEAVIPRLAPEVIAQRVEARTIRQQVLSRPAPPRFTAIVDEAVLHRAVGGPVVMRDQLERVVEASKAPNVTIQVLPYRVGAHAALDSTFIMLEFPAPMPGVIYVDGLVGQMYLEQEQDVRRYREVFDQLRALSLDPEDSIDLISQVSRTYQDG